MSLSLINLKKSFGEKKIFENFSYHFNEKGLYIITGESGVGKTTLLRIICGLDENYDGFVLGGGFKNTSFVFQEHRLFPQLSLIENLTEIFEFNSDEMQLLSKEILIKLGFSEKDFPLLPAELSGGMKQRVSIARAILKNAPILLLDEPTKELDEALREKVISLIEEESKKRLVIMVTHNEAEIASLNPIAIKLAKI